MVRNSWRTLTGLMILGSLASTGCSRGPVLAEVSGTVKLNGKPLSNVTVEFLPEPEKGKEAPRSTGATDPSGRYQLTCDNGKPGAVLGNHRVLIRDLQPYGDTFVGRGSYRDDEKMRTDPARASRVPNRYADSARTPLKKEVRAGSQTIDVDLTTP